MLIITIVRDPSSTKPAQSQTWLDLSRISLALSDPCSTLKLYYITKSKIYLCKMYLNILKVIL